MTEQTETYKNLNEITISKNMKYVVSQLLKFQVKAYKFNVTE